MCPVFSFSKKLRESWLFFQMHDRAAAADDKGTDLKTNETSPVLEFASLLLNLDLIMECLESSVCQQSLIPSDCVAQF